MSPTARPGRNAPEYGMEALGLGLFMVSACAFGTRLEHPVSPVHRALVDPHLRRVLMGVAMGLTAIALIYSPWGKRSGAHLNPATTLTFWRLGRVKTADALPYALAQFAGGAAGALVMGALLGMWLAHPAVHYVVTHPGAWGAGAAFVAEVGIAFLLMTMVLHVSSRPGIERFTGVFVGVAVALYISLEAPISGMSMNPARSLASAVAAGDYRALWIYFTAPPLGMLLAAEAFLLVRGRAAGKAAGCAKLRHDPGMACIFCGKSPTPTPGVADRESAADAGRLNPPALREPIASGPH